MYVTRAEWFGHRDTVNGNTSQQFDAFYTMHPRVHQSRGRQAAAAAVSWSVPRCYEYVVVLRPIHSPCHVLLNKHSLPVSVSSELFSTVQMKYTRPSRPTSNHPSPVLLHRIVGLKNIVLCHTQPTTSSVMM